MAEQKRTQAMRKYAAKKRTPRSLKGRNRRINQFRKRSEALSKNRDSGIYAKRRSPANKPRRV